MIPSYTGLLPGPIQIPAPRGIRHADACPRYHDTKSSNSPIAASRKNDKHKHSDMITAKEQRRAVAGWCSLFCCQGHHQPLSLPLCRPNSTDNLPFLKCGDRCPFHSFPPISSSVSNPVSCSFCAREFIPGRIWFARASWSPPSSNPIHQENGLAGPINCKGNQSGKGTRKRSSRAKWGSATRPA